MDKKNTDTLGFWSDNLRHDEVAFTKKAAEQLRASAPWAAKWLKNRRIKKALNITQGKALSPSEVKEIKAVFFEIRFAYSIFSLGLEANCQYKSGVGNTDVDFAVIYKPTLLFELTSLRESGEVKKATVLKKDGLYEYESTTTPFCNAPEVLELIKAQSVICGKVTDKDSNPIKFPLPSQGSLHFIVVDMRSFNGLGSYIGDYGIIAYGNNHFDPFGYSFITENGPEPIKGLFSPEHPNPASILIRSRIHALCFVNEASYDGTIFTDECIILPNPHFFKTADELRSHLPDGLRACVKP